MNPLDKEELKAFFKTVKNDMPKHTDNTMRVKGVYSQGLPKNLQEYSTKINNKFLNDNLHIIEEMEYRRKGITDDFKNYQNKYYDESGILNHDLYFKHDDKIYAKISGGSYFNQNMLSFSHASVNRAVNGAELSSGADEINNGTGSSGEIQANKAISLGIIGKLYDRIALSVTNSSGNIHEGVYDDSTGPNVLLADTGSIACPASSSYAFQSVTEFSLTTTQIWLALEADNTTITFRAANNSIANSRKVHNQSYGALSNPFGSIAFTDGYSGVMKTSHI